MQNTPETKNVSYFFIESLVNEVHNEIGSFFSENIYKEAIIHELKSRGYNVACQAFSVKYKNTLLKSLCEKVDIILENKVVLLIKSVAADKIDSVTQECKTYMKHLDKQKGFVVNFPEKYGEKIYIKEIILDEIEVIIKDIEKNKQSIEFLIEKISLQSDYGLKIKSLEKSIEKILNQLNGHIDEKTNIELLIEEKSFHEKITEETSSESSTLPDVEDSLPEETEEPESEEPEEVEPEETEETEEVEPEETEETETEEVESEEPEEVEPEETETEEVESEEPEEVEPEETEEVEPEETEEVEETEETEEEEVFEIEIDDITYYTNNEENGIIYEADKDSVGKQVGYLKDGEPIFT